MLKFNIIKIVCDTIGKRIGLQATKSLICGLVDSCRTKPNYDLSNKNHLATLSSGVVYFLNHFANAICEIRVNDG